MGNNKFKTNAIKSDIIMKSQIINLQNRLSMLQKVYEDIIQFEIEQLENFEN